MILTYTYFYTFQTQKHIFDSNLLTSHVKLPSGDNHHSGGESPSDNESKRKVFLEKGNRQFTRTALFFPTSNSFLFSFGYYVIV